MEIVALGTNVVECVRIGRMIAEHGERFLERVFTPGEIRQCRDRRGPTEAFAGRWAAKEAVLRCLGIRAARRICWNDVEIRAGSEGGYTVHVAGNVRDQVDRLQIGEIRVTIGQCRSYATATAVALRRRAADGPARV